MGVIQGYAGNQKAELAAYLTAIATYEKMLAANPNDPYAVTSLADLETNSAFLCAQLGRRAEGLRLGRAGVAVLTATALKPNASGNELNLAARALVRQAFPELRNYKLGLIFAKRANDAAAGQDYVILETLAEAYWLNRDREDAVRSIQEALKLVGETPRVRGVFEKTLVEYQTGKLPGA
jgi:tetratricopeptide (TPR) repeat protein